MRIIRSIPNTYKEEYEQRLKQTGVPFWPDAMWRDVVFSTLLVGVILGLAVFIGAPTLGHPPDPGSINANPMPDWYFWWYFTVLSMLPAGLETAVILGAPVAGFLILFCIPMLSNRGHRAPSKRPWAVGLLVAGFASFVALTVYGYHEPWSPDFGVPPPRRVVGVADGPVADGARLMHSKGCLYCHDIDGYRRTSRPRTLADRERVNARRVDHPDQNGGYNMPSFAGSVTSQELSKIVQFLQSRVGEMCPSPIDTEPSRGERGCFKDSARHRDSIDIKENLTSFSRPRAIGLQRRDER